MEDDLYQIALLIDNLKHDDLKLRLSASNNLVRIAECLGPGRTREELLPFLCEITDDDDEVTTVLAERLGDLWNHVGGVEYIHHLLTPLDLLTSIEESSVRNATLKSSEKIASKMSDEAIERYFVPYVTKVATKDWFTARVTASGLFHLVYQRLNATSKRTFLSFYLRLCMDDSPVVRRHAVGHMPEMLQVVSQEVVMSDFVSMVLSVAKDEQDSVRIQAIPVCAALTRVVPERVKIEKMVPMVLEIANDKWWRVRWSMASHIPDICEAMGSRITNEKMVDAFDKLLTDSEGEVRAAAADILAKFCKSLSKEKIIQNVLPSVQRLVTDPSEYVRVSLAGTICQLVALLGREGTITHLLQFILLLLRDEKSDVRLNIIANLAVINNAIGVDLLNQSLLPAIVDSAEDPKWRVRLSIIEFLPVLAEQLGKDFFNEKLSNLAMTWLGDDVYTVRRAAAEKLGGLIGILGEDWALEHIFPKVDRMRVHSSYLQRITALYTIQTLIAKNECSDTILTANIAPILLNMSGDPIPNVRFTVARILPQIYTALQQCKKTADIAECCDSCIQELNKMSSDEDRDVRLFSSQAIKSLG